MDCQRIDERQIDTLIAQGFSCAVGGDLDGAIAHYRQVLADHPDHVVAHYFQGQLLLAQGKFMEGWAECEWRPAQTQFPPVIQRWQGEPLNGAPILIAGEQGFGDNMQFVRYARLVAERGGTVIVGTQKGLGRLFQTVPGVSMVVEAGDPLPKISHYVPMLSLPYLFGTTESTIPADIPYFTPDPEKVAFWGQRLAFADDGPRVGLVWAGNADFQGDARRSPGFAPYRQLLQVPGVTFFSLQKGDGPKSGYGDELPMNMFDLGPEIQSFEDTAAILTHLDLLISSCTSPVHLAGALGRPVWVVLGAFADWRWMRNRADSPWYPTARLYRTDLENRWDPVLARIAKDLEEAFPL